MPRSASIGAASPHMFVALAGSPSDVCAPPPHVSLNGSPFFGTVWNSQSFLPVIRSNARGLPGSGPCGTSVTAAPMIATLR